LHFGVLMSWAARFRLKAAECRELAENTQFPSIRVIFARLAVSYERLAVHEELFERPSDAPLLPPLAVHEERLERALHAALLPSLAEPNEEATVNSERSWSPAG
jgi:hypothetical protein